MGDILTLKQEQFWTIGIHRVRKMAMEHKRWMSSLVSFWYVDSKREVWGEIPGKYINYVLFSYVFPCDFISGCNLFWFWVIQWVPDDIPASSVVLMVFQYILHHPKLRQTRNCASPQLEVGLHPLEMKNSFGKSPYWQGKSSRGCRCLPFPVGNSRHRSTLLSLGFPRVVLWYSKIAMDSGMCTREK